MRYFSLFTGIGGLDYGLEAIGADCVGYSEIKKSSIDIYKDFLMGIQKELVIMLDIGH